MRWSVDARIPVTRCADTGALAAALAEGPPAALLIEAPPWPIPAGAVAQVSFDPFLHPLAACDCCGGRGAAALALERLFAARAEGRCGWFDRVLALAESPEALAQLDAALAEATRFRRAA